jgi:signal transduction histidine kinase
VSALPASPPGRGTRPAFFVRAHPLRALVEAWLLGGLLLAGLLSLHANLEPNVPGQGMLFLSGGAALWCAVRGRLPRYRSRSLRWGEEVVIALLMSLSLTVGWGMGGQRIWGNVLTMANGSLDITGFLLAASGAEFLAFRLAVYAWEFWARLRRRRLLWALTHMQVQVMLVCAMLYVALFIAALFVGGYLPSRQAQGGGWVPLATSLVLTILPLLSVAVAGALAVLSVLLPPTIIFAYLLSRRTTRRLEALAAAASRLRQGDYDTRVEVQGEDEVAQLQADFNTMAGDLERAMSDLQAERDRVAALLQARRELVASVSHELRTPVATIRGYLESNLGGWDQHPPETFKHDLEVMKHEIERLQGLIDDLFALSRVEVGSLLLDMRPTDVGAIIRHRVEAMAPLAWQSGRVEMVAELPSELPLALADEARLEQILTNLLRNSLHHTLPGGIVAVTAGAEEAAVRIQVRDTGQGIAPEDLPHIWERFYRGLSSRAEAGGAGLGLALVKELAEAMGGSVAVESTVGQGSCFTVWLKSPHTV